MDLRIDECHNPLRKTIKEGISVFTALKNRRLLLEKSLPTWLSCHVIDQIVIVDWNSNDGLSQYVTSLNSEKILFAIVPNQKEWVLSQAFNLAARLTSRSMLLKMDADVQILDGFFDLHNLTNGNFFTGNWEKARNDNERHLHGIGLVFRDDFFRVNGYNEFIKTYGWDDIDLYDRLKAIGLKRSDLSHDTLYHIPHEKRTEFQQHLHFVKTNIDHEKALLNSLINRFLTETIQPWSPNQKMLSFEIQFTDKNFLICSQKGGDKNLVPADIMQQCEKMAIIERFHELGVNFSKELLNELNHNELVALFNGYFEKANNSDLQNLFYILLKFEFEKKEQEIELLKNQVDSILHSYSWKIGRFATLGGRMVKNGIQKAAPVLKKNIRIWSKKFVFAISEFFQVSVLGRPEQKINLDEEAKAFYGEHRSGWAFAVVSMASLHNPGGILLDSFIERTFHWHPDGIHPHLEPWIGFIHVPPNVPFWFESEIANQSIFATQAWKDSLPFCQGLFTLSAYHRKYLENQFNFPVNNLVHPTEDCAIKWDWEKFNRNKDKKVIQIGFWLRKLLAIYVLDVPKSYQKCFIRKENVNFDHLFEMEKKYGEYNELFNEENQGSVKTIPFLSNQDYDHLLSENIVFIDLYDASANNTVIECMVRNTPILINPIEPVVEYLGERYPFYFTNLNEACEKLQNMELIRSASAYLSCHPAKTKLTARHFIKSLSESDVYKNLVIR